MKSKERSISQISKHVQIRKSISILEYLITKSELEIQTESEYIKHNKATILFLEELLDLID